MGDKLDRPAHTFRTRSPETILDELKTAATDLKADMPKPGSREDLAMGIIGDAIDQEVAGGRENGPVALAMSARLHEITHPGTKAK